MAHTPTRCDHCGLTDTAPKVHYGNLGTWHHDCTPVDAMEDMTAHSDWHPQHEAAAKIFKACREDGVKNDELRAYVLEVSPTHADNKAFDAGLAEILDGQEFADPAELVVHIRNALKGGAK